MSQQNTKTNQNGGAFPDHHLKQLLQEGFIENLLVENINPSSLDMRIDLNTLVQVPCAFMPSKNKSTIADTLKHLNAVKVALCEGGFSLQKGNVYVAQIKEEVKLPTKFFARANPKSSTGRADVHVQLMGDFVSQYDRIPDGWSGKLYALIRTNSFPIFFPADVEISLNQLRIFKNDMCVLSTGELETLAEDRGLLVNEHKNKTLMFGHNIQNNLVELSVDLRDWGTDDCLGFVAKEGVQKPLIWKTKANEADDFFEPIPKVVDDRTLKLEQGRFYIMSSRESVHIPREYACEMVSFDDTRGEIKTHYAGFVDNGWGETKPRPLTLEVRAFEPTLVYHGQPIASMMLHHMYAPVKKGYDEIQTSNYTNQKTARLGKFFK